MSFTASQTAEIRNIVRSAFIDDPSEFLGDWIADKTLEELGLLDAVFPVGRCVVQFPDADDNDPDVAFPAAKAPAALYGGTWEAQWDDEGICFYTEPKTGDTEQTRTDGLQEDQGQGHYHNAYAGYTGSSTSDALSYYSNASSRTYVPVQDPITDGTNGTPRIGSTTKGRNRLMRVWKRTA